MRAYRDMVETIKNLSIDTKSSLNELKSLSIKKEGNVEIFYCPFDYINTRAKIVIIGITPGTTQLLNALLSAQEAINLGLTEVEVLKKVKKDGAFSGSLRNNLIKLLDNVGINKKLNVTSTASLFNEDSDLLQSTSILGQPTFVKGKDYNGSSPNMQKNALMLEQIKNFQSTIELLPNAIYIPLGNKVSKIFETFIEQNLLSDGQVLIGLPHPSGANSGRIS